MRVTIQKTISLEEMPSEILDSHDILDAALHNLNRLANDSYAHAEEGRFISCSEILDGLRQKLVHIDKSIEELQSLCISYEKIRISQQTPADPSGETGDA